MIKIDASSKGIMIDEIIISNGLNDMPLYSIEPEKSKYWILNFFQLIKLIQNDSTRKF